MTLRRYSSNAQVVLGVLVRALVFVKDEFAFVVKLLVETLVVVVQAHGAQFVLETNISLADLTLVDLRLRIDPLAFHLRFHVWFGDFAVA